MRRQTFATSERRWRTVASAKAPRDAGLTELDHGPGPAELFFETGVVLTVALGAALAVQLVFGP